MGDRLAHPDVVEGRDAHVHGHPRIPPWCLVVDLAALDPTHDHGVLAGDLLDPSLRPYQPEVVELAEEELLVVQLLFEHHDPLQLAEVVGVLRPAFILAPPVITPGQGQGLSLLHVPLLQLVGARAGDEGPVVLLDVLRSGEQVEPLLFRHCSFEQFPFLLRDRDMLGGVDLDSTEVEKETPVERLGGDLDGVLVDDHRLLEIIEDHHVGGIVPVRLHLVPPGVVDVLGIDRGPVREARLLVDPEPEGLPLVLEVGLDPPLLGEPRDELLGVLVDVDQPLVDQAVEDARLDQPRVGAVDPERRGEAVPPQLQRATGEIVPRVGAPGDRVVVPSIDPAGILLAGLGGSGLLFLGLRSQGRRASEDDEPQRC